MRGDDARKEIPQLIGNAFDSRIAALVAASVSPSPPSSGGQKRTLRLLEAMTRAGIEPRLVLRNQAGAEAREDLASRGILLEAADGERPSAARRLQKYVHRLPAPYDPVVARRMATLAAHDRLAFVQLEHIENACFGSVVPGVPVVLSLHNVDSEVAATLARSQRRGSLASLRLAGRVHSTRVTEHRAVRAADMVLCVSEDDAAHFGERASRVIVAPNGVDDEFFEITKRARESPAQSVLFFGQLDYEPNALGIDRFVREGWPIVARRHPQVKLRIVGRGLSAVLASKLDRVPGIELVGEVEDVAVELQDAGAVVVPIWQGGGTRLKVLESMAAERPIAGTPLGVAGIGFRSGLHGLVAEQPQELASALIALLDDGTRASRLAEAARGLAERFRWSEVMRPAEELYRELVEPREATASSSSRS